LSGALEWRPAGGARPPAARQEAERREVSVEQVWAERTASYPAGRLLEPDDVAKVIAFLVSDDAAAVSGEALTVALGSPW